MRLRLWSYIACFVFWIAPAHAHKPSDAYLSFQQQNETVSGTISIAVKDLVQVIALDSNHNGEITWGEVKAQRQKILDYVFPRIELSNSLGVCTLELREVLVDNLSDGTYIVLAVTAPCRQDNSFSVQYSLLFDVDWRHRGILTYSSGDFSESTIFSPEQQNIEYLVTADSQRVSIKELGTFFKSGVWHIWIGFDHVLFLLTLLLPAALLRSGKKWKLQPGLKPVFVDVTIIVTCFTIAHSLTLSLVALDYVSLPASIVEPVIALSIVAAALHNILPLWHGKRWTIAFAFGLIHGFGFAGILKEAGIQPSSIITPLLGFNVGVEVGQLVIVLAVLPLLYIGSRFQLYQPVVLTGGSIAAALLGMIWFAERTGIF